MRSILGLLVVGALATCAAGAEAAPPSGSWSTFGHDFQRTGHADGAGKMHAPKVSWTLPLGGLLGAQQAMLVTVGSQPVTVSVSGGRVVASKGDGSTLWTTSLVGPNAILGAWDLGGSGSSDIVVNTQSNVLVLASSDGHVVTSLPTGPYVQAAFAPEGGGGILVLATYASTVAGYDFRGGATPTGPAWTLTGADDPASLVGDVDGDGAPDLVRPLNDGFEIDDPLTGATKYALPGMGPLAYYYMYELANVDGQPGLEIVAVDQSYFYSPDAGIYVLGVRAGSLQTLWSSAATATTARAVDFFSVTGDVADLEGNGSLEVVYSQWDGTAGTWTTVVADAASGTQLGTIPGAFLQAVADVDGDSKAEIVTRSGVQATQTPPRSTISVYDFDSTQMGPVAKGWTVPVAHVATGASEYPASLWPGLPIPAVADFDPKTPGLEFMVGVDQSGANVDTALLTIHGTDGSTAGTYAIMATTEVSIVGVTNGLTSATSQNDVVLSRDDGTVHVADAGLNEHASFKAGTYSNWVYGIAGMTGTANLFAATSNNHLSWIDGRHLHADGTPYVLFDEPSITPNVGYASAGYPADPVVLLTGASSTLVTFEHTPNGVSIIGRSTSGVANWQVALDPGAAVGSPGAYVLDLNGDGNDDLLLGIFSASGSEALTAYDGTNGKLLASTPIASILTGADGFATGTLTDVNGDGHPDLVVPVDSAYGILAINLFAQPYGELWLASQGTSPLTVNGTVGFSSGNDAGTPALLRSNGNNGVGPYVRLALDGGFVAETVPEFTQGSTDENAAAMVAGATPGFYDLVGAGMSGVGLSRVRRVAGDTMSTVWTMYAANGQMSGTAPSPAYALHDPIALDVDGNGTDDIVFGSDDGYLYAVSSTDGSLVFSVNLGSPVSHVIASNVDLDPPLELVASLSDGRLVAIDDTYDAVTDMPDAGVDSGSLDAGSDGSHDAGSDAHVDGGVDGGGDAGGIAADASEGGSEGGSPGGGGGCGCETAGSAAPAYAGLLSTAGLVAIALARGRRRRSARH